MKFKLTVRQLRHIPGNCGAFIGKRLCGIHCFQLRSYICSKNGRVIDY